LQQKIRARGPSSVAPLVGLPEGAFESLAFEVVYARLNAQDVPGLNSEGLLCMFNVVVAQGSGIRVELPFRFVALEVDFRELLFRRQWRSFRFHDGLLERPHAKNAIGEIAHMEEEFYGVRAGFGGQPVFSERLALRSAAVLAMGFFSNPQLAPH